MVIHPMNAWTCQTKKSRKRTFQTKKKEPKMKSKFLKTQSRNNPTILSSTIPSRTYFSILRTRTASYSLLLRSMKETAYHLTSSHPPPSKLLRRSPPTT
ncbi:hypothetical protein D6D18_08249, partial [Aureobasidium pullulans]